MGKPCISQMIKHTIRWESDEKRHSLGKVWVPITQALSWTGFAAFSYAMGN